MNQDRPGLILNLLWRADTALTMDQIRTVLAERCDTLALVGTLEHMTANGRLVAEPNGDDTRYRIAEACVPPPVTGFEEREFQHRARMEGRMATIIQLLTQQLDTVHLPHSVDQEG